MVFPLPLWSFSRANRSGSDSIGVRSSGAKPSASQRLWPRAWQLRMPRAWFTATSSPTTSSLPPPDSSRFSILASRCSGSIPKPCRRRWRGPCRERSSGRSATCRRSRCLASVSMAGATCLRPAACCTKCSPARPCSPARRRRRSSRACCRTRSPTSTRSIPRRRRNCAPSCRDRSCAIARAVSSRPRISRWRFAVCSRGPSRRG